MSLAELRGLTVSIHAPRVRGDNPQAEPPVSEEFQFTPLV